MEAAEIMALFPQQQRFRWKDVAQRADELQEIRLRCGQPVMVYVRQKEWFLEKTGALTKEEGRAYILPREELEQILKHICRYSLYACEEEMSKGYVSADGGFRVGIAGEVVLKPDGTVKNIRYISSLNIRIAHEVKGAAAGLLPWIYRGERPHNILIISPVGCGKTTLLRDIVRLISDGNEVAGGITVGVVDERSELAGCFQGIPKKDVGKRTDVLDGCPKAEGMMMLLRSMAPAVVAVDELGSSADVHALWQALKCGSSVIATVHGASLEEVRDKSVFAPLFLGEAFGRIFVLGRQEGSFMAERVCDGKGNVLAEGILC